ncbi:hypothetical protein [Pseudomonas protegens]|uniref:hypothetical protein n=1 Tax=Pseudomonas protegens TaxID=380021 RepID=UPI001F204EEE|nr:hypothetical protein [Pseudomonas protegens]
MASPVWSGNAATNTTPLSSQRVQADVIRYVNKVDSDSGWLLVGRDDLPRPEWKSLFKYCKVMLIGSKKGKTYFKVLEGESKGKVAFLSDSNVNDYLGKVAPQQQPIELVVTYGQYKENWRSVARSEDLPQQLASAVVGGVRFEAAMNTSWGGSFILSLQEHTLFCCLTFRIPKRTPININESILNSLIIKCGFRLPMETIADMFTSATSPKAALLLYS